MRARSLGNAPSLSSKTIMVLPNKKCIFANCLLNAGDTPRNPRFLFIFFVFNHTGNAGRPCVLHFAVGNTGQPDGRCPPLTKARRQLWCLNFSALSPRWRGTGLQNFLSLITFIAMAGIFSVGRRQNDAILRPNHNFVIVADQY